MTRAEGGVAGVVSASAAGRIAGGLLLLGSAATFATTTGRTPGSPQRTADVWVGALAAGAGLVALSAPWDRWGRSATLLLLPGVFALLAFGNYENPDPYIAGIFFVVIAMWTGLCHRRYTTLALSPVIAFCYWWPLSLGPHLSTLVSSTVIITVAAVIIGEVLGAMQDNLRTAQENLLEAKERRFAALIQRSADVTMIFDKAGIVTYVSPSVREVLGYRVCDLEGRAISEFVDVLVDGLVGDALSAILHHSEGETFDDVAEFRIRHRCGRWIDVEAVAQDRLDDPDIAGIVVHIRDIHQRKQLERDLHRQAYHDELTGLPNRSLFRDRLEESMDRGERATVIFLDLDGFKVVNDSAGHDRGDDLLRLVARRFLSAVDPSVTLARFGGDEFAALVTDGPRVAAEVCTQLLDTLAAPYSIAGSDVLIGASAGVATAAGGESANDLIRNADTAMYAAKADRGTRVAWFEPAMRARVLDRLDTEVMLREGLARDEFVLHYQPEVDLATGEPCATEALVRWRHPEHGLVMPGAFIDVAEDSGLIVALGEWVLRTACADAVGWQAHDGRGRGVAVNVSVRQFQGADFVGSVRRALYDSGLDPGLLTVEITESVLIADIDAAAARLSELSALGVSIALDDFGTGYSSLSYLQRLPFDILKIDKSFIDEVTTDAHALALVRTINRLGHDLGLRTLVEGIEHADQAAVVRSIGCDYAQGYHFGRPVPLADLEAAWSRPRSAIV